MPSASVCDSPRPSRLVTSRSHVSTFLHPGAFLGGGMTSLSGRKSSLLLIAGISGLTARTLVFKLLMMDETTGDSSLTNSVLKFSANARASVSSLITISTRSENWQPTGASRRRRAPASCTLLSSSTTLSASTPIASAYDASTASCSAGSFRSSSALTCSVEGTSISTVGIVDLSSFKSSDTMKLKIVCWARSSTEATPALCICAADHGVVGASMKPRR